MVLGLPVIVGMICWAKAPTFVMRWHTMMSNVATLLFALIVVAAVAKNWDLIVEHGAVLAPVGVAINVAMLSIGFFLSRAVGVSLRQAATVAIESSVQNAALAVVIAFTLIKDDSMAVPVAVYSVFMYIVGIAFVVVMRRIAPPRTAEEEAEAQASMH